MKAHLILLPILIMLVGTAFASDIIDNNKYTYMWKKIDKDIASSLPESANKKLDELLETTIKEGDNKQALKAILYRYKTIEMTAEQDPIPEFIDYSEAMVDKLDKAHAAILKVEIAEAYNSYSKSSVATYDETITDDTAPREMKYWNETTFKKKIDSLYDEVLAAADMTAKLNTLDYANMMSQNSKIMFENVAYEKNMSDYLFHRIAKYYSSISDIDDVKSVWNTEKWWLPAKQFGEIDLGNDNEPIIKCLKIYQQLLNNQTDDCLRTYNDIKRYQFVNLILDEDERYITILENIYNNNRNNPIADDIACYLASELLVNKCDNDSVKAINYKKAFELCKDLKLADAQEIIYFLKKKELSVSLGKVVLPNEPIAAVVSYRNANALYYKIIKLSDDDQEAFDALDYRDRSKWIDSAKGYVSNTIKLTDEDDMMEHSTIAALPPLPVGKYILTAKYDKSLPSNDTCTLLVHFQVSQLSFIQHKDGDKTTIHVLDRKTGEPIADARIECSQEHYDYQTKKYVRRVLHTTKSDNNGAAVITSDNVKNDFCIDLFKDDDRLLTSNSNYLNKPYTTTPTLHTSFFTDRAIYRPGQTIYFKGITILSQDDDKTVVANHDDIVKLLDANYQEVASLQLSTNVNGSYSGSFVIPTDRLNGRFTIVGKNGRTTFRVEEYKRPTFEVNFNSIKELYRLNEDVTVSGSVDAYAGFSINGAKCSYRVERETIFPCRWWWYIYPNVKNETIDAGETTTDENGQFQIKFNLRPTKSIKPELQPLFVYKIEVRATSPQGETHSSIHYIRAGYSNITISDNIPNKVEKSSLNKCKVSIQNMNGQPAKSKLKYTLYRFDEPERICDHKQLDRKILSDSELREKFPDIDYYRNPKEKKTGVATNIINVDSEATLFNNINLDQGNYLIEIMSLDDTIVKTSSEFVVYDAKSEMMPMTAILWSDIDKKDAKPGDTVNFKIGSTMKNVNVWVKICCGNEVRVEKYVKVDNSVATINYAVTEADRGGLTINAAFVRNNKDVTIKHIVNVSYDNYDLDVSLATVRDNLSPGETETWEVNVKNNNGIGVKTELLATMYDASLNVFEPNYWSFSMSPRLKYSGSFSSDQCYCNVSGNTQMATAPVVSLLAFSTPSDFCIIEFDNYMMRGRGMICFDYCAGLPQSASMSMKNIALTEEVAMDYSEEETSIEADEDRATEPETVEPDDTPMPKLRENFNETAFFYPNLCTDENGNVKMSFTMPDAVTKWRLMMLAHNDKRQVGYKQYDFTSSRPVMIMPDMPRFAYDGDTMFLVANVVNTGNEAVTPQAVLEVFDALTMKPIKGVVISPECVKMNEIMPGRNEKVSWKVAFSPDKSLLAFRFTALAGRFSDAEQHTLPVLSSEVFMTQTLPFTVNAETEKSFSFNTLTETDNDERNYALTLNFSANPVWYAVQSLPCLADVKNDRAETAFYVLYANTLSAYIAKNIPNLLNYIEKWKLETPEALMSQLQKDEDLKAILLQETPWVLEAKSEAEQRSRIANLFDINNMSRQQGECLKLMSSKQTPSGGWAWMDGMPESPFITAFIVAGIGRLDKLNATNTLSPEHKNTLTTIANKAVRYIENNVANTYRTMKKAKKEWGIDSGTLNELYALSFFKQQNSDRDFAEAKKYYLGRLEKEWTDFNFNMRSKAAIVLHRNDKNETARLIIQSFKECAQKNEQIGMYWTKNYFSFDSHIATHANIITAFAEIENDNATLDQLRVWLLTQKQTNMWENSASTAEAVYALLMRGNDWLTDTKPVTLTIAGKPIATDNSTAGTGFIQRHWNANEITPDMRTLTVNNPTQHLVWGGMFRQYFVPINKVKSDTSTFKIKRELFVENNTDNGLTLTPITSCQPKVGDKIVVRITFEAQQDMNFVFVKDMRAAALEPVEQVSRYYYNDGMGYYQSITDTFTGFYIDFLGKGTHRLEYSLYVTKEGVFTNGYALIQCLYAPEFTSYSDGIKIKTVSE